MENFLYDLNDILTNTFGVEPTSPTVIILAIMTVSLGLIAAILAMISAFRFIASLMSPKPQPVYVEPKPVAAPAEVKIDVGEFGKIIDETHVMVKGVLLEYFILKKSKYEKSTLPIGTIVVIIKKNANEAYVKPAEAKDVKRLKGVL